jgi:hypothetical protein
VAVTLRHESKSILRESPESFAAPACSVEELRPTPAGLIDHAAVYADLLAALAEGRAPRCDGVIARDSPELANALTLSSHLGRTVALPIDRGAYDTLLDGALIPAAIPSAGRRRVRKTMHAHGLERVCIRASSRFALPQHANMLHSWMEGT